MSASLPYMPACSPLQRSSPYMPACSPLQRCAEVINSTAPRLPTLSTHLAMSRRNTSPMSMGRAPGFFQCNETAIHQSTASWSQTVRSVCGNCCKPIINDNIKLRSNWPSLWIHCQYKRCSECIIFLMNKKDATWRRFSTGQPKHEYRGNVGVATKSE